MATFHPFPRLTLELRIQIWEPATEDRVVRVNTSRHSSLGRWSPTPVPAVTRACQESREHCSYKKAFAIDSSPRYIWTNFDHDVIHIKSGLLWGKNLSECDKVKNLRIEVVDDLGLADTEDFWHHHVDKILEVPKLKSVDLLVIDGIAHQWTEFIKETNWGACLKANVRIVDIKTGGWVDEKSSGPYQDYVDTNGGETINFTRVVDDEEEEEDEEGRVAAMNGFRCLCRGLIWIMNSSDTVTTTRATRCILPQYQSLRVADRVSDYGFGRIIPSRS